MWGLVLTGKRTYCNSPLLGGGRVGLAAWVFTRANVMGDPTGGHADLHFTGVGSVTLAQKHMKGIGIISDLEQLQCGQETADREGEHKVLGFFFNNMRAQGILFGEVLGSGCKVLFHQMVQLWHS